MNWTSRVVWQEGMFLRAQHFQQQDRWNAHALASGLRTVRPWFWGLSSLELAGNFLASGRIGLAACSGLFEDGTYFAAPEEADLPAPLSVPDNTRDALVYLAIPTTGPDRPEFAPATYQARYTGVEASVPDTHTFSPDSAPVTVARLALKLLLETDDRAGHECIPIARITEITPDRRVILDEGWIPSVLTCRAAPALANLLIEFAGILHQRGEAMAGRLSAKSTRSNTEIADFLLLQAINGWQAVLSHLASNALIHPEELYRILLNLAGELATFTEASRRPAAFAPYRHSDLEASFAPVIEAIRRGLSSVLEQTAIQIPLQTHRHGVRVGAITDRTILSGGSIVLVVRADVPLETLRKTFPATVKIGAVEHIRELVNVALPGIELRLLPVVPRQMPFVSGGLYFELERHSSHWDAMKNSAGFALHVSNDYPNLMLELWAIRT